MHKIDFRTFYNQFYISTYNGNKALADLDWSEESYEDRMGSYENMIVVYPESYGHIKGELFFLDTPNEDINFDNYDHIVESTLNIESGYLQVLGCPSSSVEMSFVVRPGLHSVRVYFSNMQGYDSDEEEHDDWCRIEIWPAFETGQRVLKRFPRKI